MSQTAAKYAGYSTKFNQVTAMLISGAIAGILGAMVYLGKADNMPVTVAAKTIPQEGFTGISVGLIAMSNSWAILPISLLFGMIDSSKVSLQTLYGVDPAVADTIFGIVVYGAAIISIFYFLVPYKWYLRIFKGKAYANNYAQYVDNINQDLDDATSIIHYLHHQNLDQNYLNSINKDSLKLRMKKFNINFSNKMNYENVRSYKQKIYASFPNLKAIRKKELMVLVEKEKNHQLKGAK
jgi:simple sugar transport system permease protein